MSAQTAAVHDKLEPTICGLVRDDWSYILDSFKKSYRELGADGYVPKFTYWPEMQRGEA